MIEKLVFFGFFLVFVIWTLRLMRRVLFLETRRKILKERRGFTDDILDEIDRQSS